MRPVLYLFGAILAVGIIVHFVTDGRSTQDLRAIVRLDSTTNTMVDRCAMTNSDRGACVCAINALRRALTIEDWQAIGAASAADSPRAAEDALARVGPSLVPRYANAVSAAGRECKIRLGGF